MIPTSRYATTQYNRLQRVKGQIGSIYSRAIAFHFSADKLRDELSAVWQSADYKRLAAWDKGYVHGLEEGMNRDIWNNHVAWCLGPSTGPTRVALSAWTEEMSRLCREPGQLYGGHFWTDDKGEPTAHMWTEYKPTRGPISKD